MSKAHVSKQAVDTGSFRRLHFSFESARAALSAYLRAAERSPGTSAEVLLPSYIGWTSREGSGIMDPVLSSGLGYSLYRITKDLSIDIDDFRARVASRRPAFVLIAHYFGVPDLRFSEAAQIARQYGARVVEDEAHAFLSDAVGACCGRSGDACIASIHKLLPAPRGGLLIINDPDEEVGSKQWSPQQCPAGAIPSPWDYDLFAISARRRVNAAEWLRWGAAHRSERMRPLWKSLPRACVPQSMPFLVLDGSRDRLHAFLNEQGFGTVSLYHTLASQVKENEYPDAHWLSRHIINFPVHQDVRGDCLARMLDELERWLAR